MQDCNKTKMFLQLYIVQKDLLSSRCLLLFFGNMHFTKKKKKIGSFYGIILYFLSFRIAILFAILNNIFKKKIQSKNNILEIKNISLCQYVQAFKS